MTTTTPEPVDVVGVAAAARILGQKKSNVANFLRRREIHPVAFERGKGQRWATEDVVRAKAEYDADEKKTEADAKRRAAALGEVVPQRQNHSKPRPRLGPSQREALLLFDDADQVIPTQFAERANALRLTFLGLEKRGLVKALPGRPRPYRITAAGRKARRLLG